MHSPHRLVVAWTGHRPDLFQSPAATEAAVHAVACELVRGEAVSAFALGGQRGVDTWAADAAIEQGVAFTLILPLEPAEFGRDWSVADHRALDHTLARARAVRVHRFCSRR